MIIFVNGCMAAGKSKWIIEEASSEKYYTVDAFKPMSQNRAGDFIVSRGTDKKLPCKRVMDITEVLGSKADCVIIDEYQFFNSDQLKYILQELKKKPFKTVIVAGLDKKDGLNYWTNYHIVKEFADKEINLKAVCDNCKRLNATISRLAKIGKDGSYSTTKGAEYEILCQACYDMKNLGKKNEKRMGD